MIGWRTHTISLSCLRRTVSRHMPFLPANETRTRELSSAHPPDYWCLCLSHSKRDLQVLTSTQASQLPLDCKEILSQLIQGLIPLSLVELLPECSVQPLLRLVGSLSFGDGPAFDQSFSPRRHFYKVFSKGKRALLEAVPIVSDFLLIVIFFSRDL